MASDIPLSSIAAHNSKVRFQREVRDQLADFEALLMHSHNLAVQMLLKECQLDSEHLMGTPITPEITDSSFEDVDKLNGKGAMNKNMPPHENEDVKGIMCEIATVPTAPEIVAEEEDEAVSVQHEPSEKEGKRVVLSFAFDSEDQAHSLRSSSTDEMQASEADRKPTLVRQTTMGYGTVHEIWREAEPDEAYEQDNRVSLLSISLSAAAPGGDDPRSIDYLLAPLMRHPDSSGYVFWVSLSCIVIIYDAIMLPLMFLTSPEGVFFVIMTWCTSFFWTADIPLQALTGYHHEGKMELRFSKTIQRYLRSWLLFDIGLVTVDWVALILDESGGTTLGVARAGKQTARFSRIVRLLRLLRLLRLFKLMQSINKVYDAITSEYLTVVTKIAFNVASIMGINHYIACGWFALAEFPPSEAPVWMMTVSSGKDDFATHGDDYYHYIVSLHWSLTQFTPATQDVHPVNAWERTYAVIVVLTALVTFSSFVSSITAAMTQLRSINGGKMAEESRIREYLRRKNVSAALSQRLWRYWRQKCDAKRRLIRQNDITFFSELPESLLIELRSELYHPSLTTIPVFVSYSQRDSTALTMLCHLAIAERGFLPEEDIFIEGQLLAEAFFTSSGLTQYQSSLVGSPIQVDWECMLCEAALWCRYRTVGRLKALGTCELLRLDVSKFHTVVAERRRSMEELRRYAIIFVEEIVMSQRTNGSTDTVYTDLPVSIKKALSMARRAYGVDRPKSTWNVITSLPLSRTTTVGRPSRKKSGSTEGYNSHGSGPGTQERSNHSSTFWRLP